MSPIDGSPTPVRDTTPSLPGLWHLVPAALLAVGVGIVASLDPLVAPLLDLDLFGYQVERIVPYLLTVSIVVLCCALTFLVTASARLFALRYQILTGLLVLAPIFPAIGVGRLNITDVVFLAALIALLAIAFMERIPLRAPLPLVLLLMALAALAVTSIVNGRITSMLSEHILLSKFLWLLLMSFLIMGPRLLRLACNCLIAGAAISSVLAIASQIVFFTTGMILAFGDDANRFKETPLGMAMRATAFQPTAHALAHLLTLALALTLMLRLRNWQKLVLVPLLALGIGTCFTTGGFLVLGALLALAPFLLRPNRTVLYLLAALSGAVVLYLLGGMAWVVDNFLSAMGGSGFEERAELMRWGVAAIHRHPILGIGVRNFLSMYDQVVHCAYVQVAVELGLPAGVIFTSIVAFFLGACAFLAASGTRSLRQLFKGLLLGMATLAVMALFEPIYDNSVTWMFLGLVTSAVTLGLRRASAGRVKVPETAVSAGRPQGG
ncbi:MAG: hypothetical protein AB1486_08615 [Planctomycetota bacterium]